MQIFGGGGGGGGGKAEHFGGKLGSLGKKLPPLPPLAPPDRALIVTIETEINTFFFI